MGKYWKTRKNKADYMEILLAWLCGRIVLIWLFDIAATVGEYSYSEMIHKLWDAEWYCNIAAYGYGYHPASLAFFPLIPFLIRVFTPFGTVILNVLCSLISCYLVYALAKLRGQEWALNGAIMYAVSPLHIYSMLPYTEMIFITLTIIAVLLYEKRKASFLMGIVVGLSVCARSVGMVLVVAIAVCETINFIREKNIRNYLKNWKWVLPAFCLSVIHPIICYLYSGNPLAFLKVQIFWRKENVNLFTILPKSLYYIITCERELRFYWWFSAVDLAIYFVFILYVIWMAVKMIRDKKIHFEAIYGLFYLIMLSKLVVKAVTPLASFPRYICGNPEIYVNIKLSSRAVAFGIVMQNLLTIMIGFLFYVDFYFY